MSALSRQKTAASRGARKFGRDERGIATIEFVVTLPLLVGALAFAFEFGSYFLAHQETVNNVRSAARFLARSANVSASANDAITIVRTGRFGGTAIPEYLNATNAAVTVSSSGGVVTVNARVNYPVIMFGLLGSPGTTSIPFNVRENVRHVGS
jgi:Flp pilus assembly protein TadG